MIVVLNGYPGVGKLTVGRALIERIGGRLLDVHSVYNVAFALTEFKSPEFRSTVEKVEAIGHDLIRALPEDVPIVLTHVLTDDTSDWGQTEWDRLQELGRLRPPFCVVHLSCTLDENIKRIGDPGRNAMRKLRDEATARRNQDQARPLTSRGADHLLKLDTTGLTAADAADRIAEWLPAAPRRRDNVQPATPDPGR